MANATLLYQSISIQQCSYFSHAMHTSLITANNKSSNINRKIMKEITSKKGKAEYKTLHLAFALTKNH